MPAEWLRRFPSLQNLTHPPERRVPSLHLFDRRGVVLAGHVALCEQDMRVGEAAIRGAYVEDVATHPAMLGRGIASRLLRAAVDVACRDGCDIGALGTGIPGFYERLGWRRWTGPATYLSSQGEITTDAGTMVLPITQRGAELLHAPAGTSLHVGRRLA